MTSDIMVSKLYEPQHEKTNKMAVRPAKTQISLGIRFLIIVFSSTFNKFQLH